MRALKFIGALIGIVAIIVIGAIPFLALCVLTLFCDTRKLRDV